jgi:hypothetical protein
MEVLKLDDLGPDGIRMVVDWDRMRTGDSVFVPCLNVSKAASQVRAVFERRGWKSRLQLRTEHNILGLRIWRIT